MKRFILPMLLCFPLCCGAQAVDFFPYVLHFDWSQTSASMKNGSMPKECRFGKSVLPLNVTYTETGTPVIYVSGAESLLEDCVNYLGSPKITFDHILVEELSAMSVNVSGSLPSDFSGAVSIAVWFTETKVMWSVLLEPTNGSAPEWRFAVTKRHTS